MIRKYHRGDALKVAVQPWQKDEYDEALLNFDEVGVYSLVDDENKVLAVLGFIEDEDNSAQCFALVSGEVGRRLIELVRFFNYHFSFFMEKFELTRLTITVKKAFAQGVRFARLLGFRFVADLPQFYNNNDYQLFERIYEQ